jgi:hypothetical protein
MVDPGRFVNHAALVGQVAGRLTMDAIALLTMSEDSRTA